MKIFTYTPPRIPWLDIIYVDEYMVVINKPTGLLTNPGISKATHDCALTRLMHIYSEIYLVHRLDCDTSGVIVFARTKKAESYLKTQFQERKASKIYIAKVIGNMQNTSGIIDFRLMPDKDNIPFQKVSFEGKESITYYKAITSTKESSVVILMPKTGRTHQLRVHLQALGFPILGDTFYSNSIESRLCLHAMQLKISHPNTKNDIVFKANVSFSLDIQSMNLIKSFITNYK